jgi:hypothetical protein
VKVGDLVIQGERVMKMHKIGKGREPSRSVGTIIAVRELPVAGDDHHSQWTKLIGGTVVDVVWSCGKVSENFAANSLEVISEVG